MALSPAIRRLARPAAPLALFAASGCTPVLFDSAGTVARQQGALIWWSVGLMLLIILPVMALTVLFAWRYRETNDGATYAPDWDHSTGLELVIWAAPLMIVIALGALTWTGTHLLDPYRPMPRTAAAAGRAPAAAAPPLEVQVVSLDWKWLFIYPEQGIATVNRLVLPVDRPVRFRMTSSSVMNTFWVPAMAGMIYTMPGMETTLHASFDRAGDFEGLSGNYSGAGFSGMHFRTLAVSTASFDRFVAKVRAQPRALDRATYLRLVRPSENVAPMGFGGVERGLYDRIVGMCAEPATPCMGSAMHGGTTPGINDRAPPPAMPEGALMRDPSEKAPVPHLSAPHGGAPGRAQPGHPANRDLTLNIPFRPAATARA